MSLTAIASANLSLSILLPNSWLYVWKTAEKFNHTQYLNVKCNSLMHTILLKFAGGARVLNWFYFCEVNNPTLNLDEVSQLNSVHILFSTIIEGQYISFL